MSSYSLLASLGAAFHNSLFSLKSLSANFTASSSFRSYTHHNPELAAFEAKLACQLDDLHPSEEAGCLSSAWLCDAGTLILKAHTGVEVFLPDLEKALANGYTKWLDVYLDDSVKLVDTCSALREAVVEIKNYCKCINLALHSLSQSHVREANIRRAKNALSKCAIGLKKKDGQKNRFGYFCRSKLENCSSMLRRMTAKLNMEDAHKGDFFMASYAAQMTTVFVCEVLAFALSIKSCRPLSITYASGQSAWASSLSILQQKIKEHLDKKRTKGMAVVLKELQRTESAASMVREYIDEMLRQRDCAVVFEQLDKVKGLVGTLQACYEALRKAVFSLESNIKDVMEILVSSRLALLEIYDRTQLKAVSLKA